MGGLEDSPALRDLEDHLRDLDAHLHDVLSHVAHVRLETESR